MADAATPFGEPDGEGKVAVRTAFRPGEQIRVSVHEATTLEKKGLLYTGSATTDEAAVKAAEKAQAAARAAAQKEG